LTKGNSLQALFSSHGLKGNQGSFHRARTTKDIRQMHKDIDKLRVNKPMRHLKTSSHNHPFKESKEPEELLEEFCRAMQRLSLHPQHRDNIPCIAVEKRREDYDYETLRSAEEDAPTCLGHLIGDGYMHLFDIERSAIEKVAAETLNIVPEHHRCIKEIQKDFDRYSGTKMSAKIYISRAKKIADEVEQLMHLMHILRSSLACIECEVHNKILFQMRILQNVLTIEKDIYSFMHEVQDKNIMNLRELMAQNGLIDGNGVVETVYNHTIHRP
ncbi:MAG: hypothetical protein EB075_13730, partial [Bacteroidetes bacterium]|nr:hypothetical protein [Bacteroidota bacterium]